MKYYRFFAVMPEQRKSKNASKQFPFQPWTVSTLRTYAEQGQYVECLAIVPETLAQRHDDCYDCAGALMADNDQAVCGSSCNRDYLRKRCTRVPESLARKLHPALFRYLNT